MAPLLMALLLHLPMQDNAASTAVLDVSPSGTNGTLDTGTTAGFSVAGPGNMCPRALGVTGGSWIGYSSINFAGGDPFTISFFSNIVPGGNGLMCEEIQHGYGGGTIVIEDSLANTPSISYSPTDGWHHFAITKTSAGACALFVDGESIGNMTGTLSGAVSFDTALDSDLSDFYPAADLKIYDEVRSKPEIQADAFRGGFRASHYSAPLGSRLGIKLFNGQLGG